MRDTRSEQMGHIACLYESLYTRKKAANYLGVSLRTIDYLVAAGKLQHLRLQSPTAHRGMTRFTRKQLDAYARSCELANSTVG